MTLKICTIGILVLLALGAAGATLFVYSGAYNVAATEQHTKPVFQLLDYALRRSVRARINSIKVPNLTDPQRIRRGAGHYREHCLQCHGAPGVSPHSLAFGMKPAPANLVSTAREWPTEEIFWVIKHGIKMSGMPAWEYQLGEQDIWETVAFIKMMSTLSPKEYAALSNQLPKQTLREPWAAPAPAPVSVPASMPPPIPASVPAPGALLGNAKAGRRAIEQYLCATCHQIPGIVGANRHVGPPLNGIGSRKYIAGVISNTPENMVHWLKHPQQLDPLSAMPDLGVTEKDARDIAAYLYTLDDVE